ncbi:MAG: hypothetical protein ACK5LZ_06075 [Anaerorhabdus sp.]
MKNNEIKKADENLLFIVRGDTPADGIEEFEEMNESYRQLGGNGTAKIMLGKSKCCHVKARSVKNGNLGDYGFFEKIEI